MTEREHFYAALLRAGIVTSKLLRLEATCAASGRPLPAEARGLAHAALVETRSLHLQARSRLSTR